MLSDAACRKIQSLMATYPEKRSALIPALQIAQDEAGCLSPEIIGDIARLFDLTPIEVRETLSFYSMLRPQGSGKHLIQICTNISCMLCNAEAMVEHMERRLGIKAGDTTADGKFTLMEVECLGSCGASPAMRINEEYYENLTPEKIDTILDSLQ